MSADPANSTSTTADRLARPSQGRARVIVIAMAGVAPIALLVQWSDMVVGGTMSAGPFPPLAACLQWSILLALNAIAGRRAGARPFLARGELLVVLAVWLTANMVVGRGMLHPLLASLAGPVYYARSGAVKDAVAQHVPGWLALKDPNAAAGFFEGAPGGVPWSAWRRPLLTWSLFLLPFLTANVCIGALFERVWVRHEKLAFPLVALPLEAVRWADGRPETAAFRRAVRAGIAIPILLHGFGAAHAYAPSIPCVPFFNDVSAIVTTPPWTAALPLYLNIYPLLIGLTFLAPTDVTLSVWFFLLLNKAEMIAAAAMGWSEGATGGAVAMPPYVEEQSAGAFLMLAAVLVWNARHHLRQIAVARPGSEYRVCRLPAVGFALGTAGILAWCVWTGMPFWFAACFFGFYFAVAIVLGRLMAEGGIPWILAPILPDKLLLSLTGSGVLSPMATTRLTLHVQHLRDTRQLLAPSVFEAGKLRDSAGFPVRRFHLLILAAAVLALVIGAAGALPTFYRYGALALAPNSDGLQMSASVIPTTGIAHASARLAAATHPAPAAGAAVALGGGVTWILAVLRVRYLWWPLHPLGYALTGTLQLGYANKMLFSVFIGWALKSLTLRFGGAHGFRLLRGLAMGLILGDLLMGGVLKVLEVTLGPSGYAIF